MAVEHVSSLSEFMTILKTTGKRLVVVDFHATWCGPCHAIAPFYEQLSRRYEGRARFLKVDVDAAEDVARHCSVSAMPTFHMYKEGQLVSNFSGADQQRLQSDIERHAPSSADVAFGGSGHKLGSSSAAPAPSSAGPPKPDANVRETAAAAAAKRMEAMAAAKAAAKAAAAAPAANADDSATKSNTEPAPGDSAGVASGNVTQQHDSRLKVDPNLLRQLVDEMGFPAVRAEKALILTGNKGVEQAVEWCFEHADDPDVDEPLQVVTKDGAPKPKLTPEEAKKKADELYARARAKRQEEEKKEERQREKDRIRSGKEVTEAKLKLEEQSRKRAIEERRREKLEAMRERQRVRDMLEADKQRRREKFNMPGSNPAPKAPVEQPPAQKPPSQPSAAGGKIQLRLPDGSRVEGEFGPEQTMGDLVSFLAKTRPDLNMARVVFSQQYPRRKFAESDYGSTLADLNLLPRGALTVSLQ